MCLLLQQHLLVPNGISVHHSDLNLLRLRLLLLEPPDENVRVLGVWAGQICGEQGDAPGNQVQMLPLRL